MKRRKNTRGIAIYSAVLIIFALLMLFRLYSSAQETRAVPEGTGQHSTEQPSSSGTSAGSGSSQAQSISQTRPQQTPTLAGTEQPEQEVPDKHVIRKPVPDQSVKTTKKPKKVLIIVIDDVGYNTFQLEPFLKFPGPISFAILPSLDYTQAVQTMIAAAGKSMLLHQPMEAIGLLDAGPGAIMERMDDETIQRVIEDNLAQLPLARGMNNHMGSLASQDERVMKVVLDACRKAGIYYLDSVTIGNSLAGVVARSMQYRILERTVFLDNNQEKSAMQNQVREAARVAEKRGYAVMIGHVWSNELAQTLIELYPHLIESGFSFATIEDFMMDYDDDEFDFGD